MTAPLGTAAGCVPGLVVDLPAHAGGLPPLPGRLRWASAGPPPEMVDVRPVPPAGLAYEDALGPRARRWAVVHVGAHHGEELEAYLAAGFRHIVLVEPNPRALARLQPHVQFWRAWLACLAPAVPRVRISVLPVAAACHDGHATLYDTQFSLQASLLKPDPRHIQVVGTQRVVTRRLDQAVVALGLCSADVHLLVVDTQGSELQVLEGAAATVAACRALVVEVDHGCRYAGQAAPTEIHSWLERRGLRRTVAFVPTNGECSGDEVYARPEP